MSKLSRLKALLTEPRKVTLVDPEKNNSPVDLSALISSTGQLQGTEKILNAILRELKDQRRTLETIRIASTSAVMNEVYSFAQGQVLSQQATLEKLAGSELSFSRFGDGEFRLMLRSDFNLRFQSNSDALRQELSTILTESEGQLLVGFPQVFRDAHWSGVWEDLWPELSKIINSTTSFGNSHVSRPQTFTNLGQTAVDLWRSIWEGKKVLVISGEGSRFNMVPALFNNVASSQRIDSLATNAYADIVRVERMALDTDTDIALIALGPAGTILASRLAKRGLRALDIGHLSNSYDNVFENAARPEAQPITTTGN